MIDNMQEEFNGFLILLQFFADVFGAAEKYKVGHIDIRTSPQDTNGKFFMSASDATVEVHKIITEGSPACYGINPRYFDPSGNHSVEYLTTFHAEILFGHDMPYKTLEGALKAVGCPRKPSIIVSTGEALQCLWLLKYPIHVGKVGIETLEKVNQVLASSLGGNMDSYDITEYFKAPSFEMNRGKDIPQTKVMLVSNNRIRYSPEDFGLKYSYSQMVMQNIERCQDNNQSLNCDDRSPQDNAGC